MQHVKFIYIWWVLDILHYTTYLRSLLIYNYIYAYNRVVTITKVYNLQLQKYTRVVTNNAITLSISPLISSLLSFIYHSSIIYLSLFLPSTIKETSLRRSLLTYSFSSDIKVEGTCSISSEFKSKENRKKSFNLYTYRYIYTHRYRLGRWTDS